ncbi:hypothetical protein FDECE_8650 [Fusarium decemcellulare]|nr:hypothetical protein FDECE_8650 [Fusarium decemcellulare]
MAHSLDLSKPDRPVHVGVLLMEGETEIIDVAPVDFLYSFSKKFVENFPTEMVSTDLKAQAIDFQFHWVSKAGPDGTNKLTGGLTILPTDSFESCPPLDIVIIGAHTNGYIPNESELNFVRKTWNDCSAFITVCGGIQVPLLAGLLKDKTATGPRFILDMFRQQSLSTNWVEKRWVRDGKLWTSGALLNGMDLMHNFMEHYWGGGDDRLVGFMSKLGGWPNRDIDYKDVPWKL